MELEPTLEEVLDLVSFYRDANGDLQINQVYDDVHGSIHGDVRENVYGTVHGNVERGVLGNVG